jgi:heavy metal sensor kinase
VPLRVRSQAVEIAGQPYTIQAAAPLHDLQQGLRDSLWVLIPTFPLVLLLASAGGYWMSRKALAPVDQITHAARTISADDLSKRIETPATGDELERLAATLNDMIERLESAFRRVNRFTADASHELRTPLAVIRTTAEVALRGSDAGGAHRDALEQILAELERTSHLVENLLLIAKADAGKPRFARRPVDAVAAAREACAQAAVLAKEKDIRLDVRLPDRQLWVAGDFQALRQLFLILLDNAVKYTHAGGRCEVSVTERDDAVVSTVTDSGIGIAASDLPLIFDRFYRVDSARHRQRGAGLGLSIGRTIVEAHGGEIGVTSEVQRGSSFEFRLPKAAAAAPAASATTRAASRAGDSATRSAAV